MSSIWKVTRDTGICYNTKDRHTYNTGAIYLPHLLQAGGIPHLHSDITDSWKYFERASYSEIPLFPLFFFASLLYISIAYYLQKGGRGGQIA